MDPVSCSQFLTTYQRSIESNCLMDILQCLPQSERYSFALKHHQDIIGSCTLWVAVLETLPEHDRYNYVNHCAVYLSFSNAFQVIPKLPENYHLEILKNCYTSCAMRVGTWEMKNIACHINNLSSSIKYLYFRFVCANIADTSTGKLTQGKRLAYALHFTPKIERMQLGSSI